MWTLTRRRTCDSEQPVIDSLNTCDPVKQAVPLLRTWVIKSSVLECPYQKDQIQKGQQDFGDI